MEKKPLTIIVAIANRNAIGLNNQMLCHLPDDLKRFKRITMGHNIIMGRKTWESVQKALTWPQQYCSKPSSTSIGRSYCGLFPRTGTGFMPFK